MASKEDQIRDVQLILDRLALRGSVPTDDPVIVLFRKYPYPEQLQSVEDKHDEGYVNYHRGLAVEAFRMYDRNCRYLSTDHDYIYYFVLGEISQKLKIPDPNFDHDLQTALTRLAFSKHLGPQSHGTPMGEKRARIFEHYRWVARGRQDGQFHFITDKLTGNKPSPPPNGSVMIGTATAAYGKFEVLPLRRQLTELCCPDVLIKGPCRVFCNECAIRPCDGVTIGMRFYCDLDCANRISPSHEEECLELKSLIRVISLFSDISKYFEQRYCRFTIASVTEADGLIVVQEKDPRQGAGSTLQPCPTSAATPDQWRVVEGEFASFDWFYVTELMTKILLRYTCKSIRKMIFYPKNAYKTVKRILPDGKHVFNMLQTHEIVCITMPSGLELAFDPFGARYGWREVLSPLSDYVLQRVQWIKSKTDIDLADKNKGEDPTYSIRTVDTPPRQGRHLYKDIELTRKLFYGNLARELLAGQLTWLHEKSEGRLCSFQEVPQIPDEAFTEMRKHSLDQVKRFVDAQLEKVYEHRIL